MFRFIDEIILYSYIGAFAYPVGETVKGTETTYIVFCTDLGHAMNVHKSW